MIYRFDIDPCAKPRMTRRDRWMKRKATTVYWAFKDELVKQADKMNFKVPASHYHLKFYIPMSNSWSVKKKELYLGKPHQQKPDKDNLEKAFLDCLCEDDSYVWDGRVSKFWSDKGSIVVELI